MPITTDVYARLAAKVYEDIPPAGTVINIGDLSFEVKAIRDDNRGSGYYGAIFYNEASNEIIVAHRGTEGVAAWDIKIRDFIADAQMATQEINQQELLAGKMGQVHLP